MSLAATLIVCSLLNGSNPSGDTIRRQDARLMSNEEQIAAIRLSPFSEPEKAKRIAGFIKEGMSEEQVEKMLRRPVIRKGIGDFYVILDNGWMIHVRNGKPIHIGSVFT